MNNITIMGRLTHEPEIRKTAAGQLVANFTVAVNRTYKSEQKADFIRCAAWDKKADIVSAYLHKGSGIAVTGHLQVSNYEDSAGVKRTKCEVICDSLFFPPTSKSATAADIQPEFEEIPTDDDLPF